MKFGEIVNEVNIDAIRLNQLTKYARTNKKAKYQILKKLKELILNIEKEI